LLSRHEAICEHRSAATVEANFRDALPDLIDRL
jgi:hypothetical protein